MTLLTLEQLLEIHVLVVEETGGSVGLRDLGRLESAIATQTQNVFDEELYRSTSEKAAAMVRSIIADHPFVDGNKRTAMLAGLTLLRINKTSFHAQQGEIEDFAVLVAVEKLDVPTITQWLHRRSADEMFS
jgi:death-on-curing protein